MEISKHANKRSQQRGIPRNYLDIITRYGTPVEKPGNAFEYRLHKKDKDRIIQHLKRLIQCVDKCTGKAVLMDSNKDTVVTAYNLKNAKCYRSTLTPRR